MTITLAPATVTDAVCEDSVVVGLNPEADVGFFSMSPASAEQVTVQIRTVLDRVWEFIALAYKGRAFLALGYGSWDEYVDARFGDLRLAVPREHRTQVVATLAGARMSVRAIAKLLGVGVATVHRELVRSTGVPNGTPQQPDAVSTLGRDGKSYPRDLRATNPVCSTCGEIHSDRAADCPWDLFAQGLGPHPGFERSPGFEPDRDRISTLPAGSTASTNRRSPSKRSKNGMTGLNDNGPIMSTASAGSGSPIDVLVDQLEALLKDVNGFASRVTTFETISIRELSETAEPDSVAMRIRSLIICVSDEFASWPDCIARLQRLAAALEKVD